MVEAYKELSATQAGLSVAMTGRIEALERVVEAYQARDARVEAVRAARVRVSRAHLARARTLELVDGLSPEDALSLAAGDPVIMAGFCLIDAAAREDVWSPENEALIALAAGLHVPTEGAAVNEIFE